MGRAMAVVLFTDLVGSTELRGRLGDEAAEELRRTHDQLLASAVGAHSGRVVKSRRADQRTPVSAPRS